MSFKQHTAPVPIRSSLKAVEIKPLSHAELEQKVNALSKELTHTHQVYETHLSILRSEFERSINTLREESRAWRASSEDEFCRLVATCTKQLTALQEKFDRSIRHEAFLSARLEDLRQENSALKETLAKLQKNR